MNRSMVLCTALLLMFAAIRLTAQTKSIDRKYVPIVLKGYQMTVPSMRIDKWRAYRYDAAGNLWRPIPFQVDEVDADGDYNNETDGQIDTNDEVLLMPEDLGDRAPAGRWLEDQSSRNGSRIELAFSDTSDGLKEGWIYLFQDVSNPPVVEGYLSYSPPPAGTAADTAKSKAYQIGYNENGWIDHASLSLNPHLDLIDRLKLRLSGNSQWPGIGEYVVTENVMKASEYPSTSPHIGIIRAFLDRRANLTVPFWPTPIPADHQVQFLPYCFRLSIIDVPLNPIFAGIAGLQNLRYSLDFSAKAEGLRFYSEKSTEGIPIDGVPDNPDISLDPRQERHWLMASGDLGTVMVILDTINIANSTVSLYYRDDASGGTNDDSPDTGDNSSYGDMGLWVAGESLVTNKITMNFTAYFIDRPNLDAAFAARLFSWEQHKLVFSVSEQSFDPTSVGGRQGLPEGFQLFPAYPNPFNAGRQTLNIDFEVASFNEPSELVIFNTLGQEIIRRQNYSPSLGRQTISWDGRGANGQAVPPGIYFCRLQQGHLFKTQKLLIF
jgi:hypothetical protein